MKRRSKKVRAKRYTPEQRAAQKAARARELATPKFSFSWRSYPYKDGKTDFSAEPSLTRKAKWADEAVVTVHVNDNSYTLETRITKGGGDANTDDRWTFPGATRSWALPAAAAHNLWKATDLVAEDKKRKAEIKRREAAKAAHRLAAAIAQFQQHHLSMVESVDEKFELLAKRGGLDPVAVLKHAYKRARYDW